jgi:hypothetical protein
MSINHTKEFIITILILFFFLIFDFLGYVYSLNGFIYIATIGVVLSIISLFFQIRQYVFEKIVYKKQNNS